MTKGLEGVTVIWAEVAQLGACNILGERIWGEMGVELCEGTTELIGVGSVLARDAFVVGDGRSGDGRSEGRQEGRSQHNTVSSLS